MSNFNPWLRRIFVPAMMLGSSVAYAAESSIPEPLPEEEMRVETLTPADGNRLFVSDFVFRHMMDGRMHVLDGPSGRYLGMIPIGGFGLTTVSPKGDLIYSVLTYYPKVTRGERNDVLEIHDAQTLKLKAEIELPPKRAQSASYRSLLTLSADGRFIYVQNATPATSVTVVDLHAQKVVSEIATPGCWSMQGWSEGYRFSAICGDGTLLTVTLDEHGQPVSRERSQRFFDPDEDPIYIHPEINGDQRYFVSYLGNVYTVTLSGAAPAFSQPWPLLDEADRKQAWRPGGMQISALHQASGTLFVNMHDNGAEGTHKYPSKEIWAYDLAARKRIARIPSNHASSITASQGENPLLYAVNVEKGEIMVRSLSKKGYPLMRNIEGAGETSIFLEVR